MPTWAELVVSVGAGFSWLVVVWLTNPIEAFFVVRDSTPARTTMATAVTRFLPCGRGVSLLDELPGYIRTR